MNLLSPGVKVVPRARPHPQLLSISGCMHAGIKALRLLVQEEGVSVRRAARRRRRADVVGDEWGRGVESRRLRLRVRVSELDLVAGLDPVQDWA